MANLQQAIDSVTHIGNSIGSMKSQISTLQSQITSLTAEVVKLQAGQVISQDQLDDLVNRLHNIEAQLTGSTPVPIGDGGANG